VIHRNFIAPFILLCCLVFLQGCANTAPTYARQNSLPAVQPELRKLPDPEFPVGTLVGHWEISGKLDGEWKGKLSIFENKGKMNAILEFPQREGVLREYFDVTQKSPHVILQGLQYRTDKGKSVADSLMTISLSWNEKSKKFVVSDFYNQNGEHGSAHLKREPAECAKGNCLNVAERDLQQTVGMASDHSKTNSKPPVAENIIVHSKSHGDSSPIKDIVFRPQPKEKVHIDLLKNTD
jgi:hypothetical protein